MIEITQANSRQEDKTKIKNKKRSSSVGESKKSFTSELQNNIMVEFEGSIEELLDDLKDQEKNFLNNPSDYELVRYKTMVKKILKSILDEGLRAITLKKLPDERKVFTIVKEIDNKILEMAKAITGKNPAFNYLKSIEEIRGMILDLLY